MPKYNMLLGGPWYTGKFRGGAASHKECGTRLLNGLNWRFSGVEGFGKRENDGGFHRSKMGVLVKQC